jgi:hypothetical protein
VTSVIIVTLDTAAADNPGGSGVRWMYFRDWKWDEVVVQWVKVRDSGWIDYAETYPWALATGEGIKYVGAWFADAALNVSTEVAMDSINLVQDGVSIGEGQVILYREYLGAGSQATLSLVPSSGDPDLYVWKPDSTGYPDYYSNNSGTAPDTVSFTAPVNGIYQIEVHGYTDAVYALTLTNTSVLRKAENTAGQTKPMPTSSMTMTDPGEETPPSAPTPNQTYLPLILKNPHWETQ